MASLLALLHHLKEATVVQSKYLSTRLAILLAIVSVFVASCIAAPTTTEPQPPTPTPLPGSTHFFDPARISAETKAIEAQIVNCSGRVPKVESAIVITEPAALQAITTTILNAMRGAPLADMPAVQQRNCYMIALYFYTRDDVLPTSGTSGRWMIGSMVYNYQAGFIGLEEDTRKGPEMARYPVDAALLEALQREFASQGIALPR